MESDPPAPGPVGQATGLVARSLATCTSPRAAEQVGRLPNSKFDTPMIYKAGRSFVVVATAAMDVVSMLACLASRSVG